MATEADRTALQTEITRLETLINAGVTSTTQDGQSVAFDIPASRRRLRELREELAVVADDLDSTTTPKRRPIIVKANLS